MILTFTDLKVTSLSTQGCSPPSSSVGLRNVLVNFFNLSFDKHESFVPLNKVSGVLRKGQTTLLIGPPGSGKTTLLRALAGRLRQSELIEGEIRGWWLGWWVAGY